MRQIVKEMNRCDKCKYYVRHYIRSGMTFRTACCGHCASKERNNGSHNKYRLPEEGGCELWAPIEIDASVDRAQIERTMREILVKLNDIAGILSIDIQNENPSD